MAKQTQEEKLIAQINAARQAGDLTRAEAQELRRLVRDNSTNGNSAQGIGKQVSSAIGSSGGGGGGGGKPSDTPSSGGPRPTNPSPNPGPGPGTGDGGQRPGGPPTGPIGQPPGPAPEGQEWVWDGDQWILQGDPVEPDEEVKKNVPMPTTPPGDGMYWEPIQDADGWITGWAPKPIPGYMPPVDKVPDGFSEQDKEGARYRLKQLLTNYGIIDDSDDSKKFLEFLNGLISKWGGNNDTTIMSYLRDNDFYKKRFSGNEARIKNGYAAMSEAEYIGVESEIRAKMRDFGLNDAFYTNERIATLIGGDVSAAEVSDRLTKAKKIVDNADANIKGSLVSLYGATLGDLYGYVLDPKLAQEGLQRKVNAGVAYGVAKGNGLTLDTTLAEQVGELTYGDERTARQSLGQAGDMARSVRRLQSMESDIQLTDADVVEQQFGLDAESGRKVKKLQSRERARFTGSSGAFSGTLNDSTGY